MADLVLGIDIGTASTKVIAFDANGREVASAIRPYPLLSPRPGWVEQDPEQVWKALLDSLHEVSDRTAGDRVLSLALAAQACSTIPCDAAGDPVHPMVTWLDRRTDDLVASWKDDGTAGKIRELSGWHPFPGLPLSVIVWMAAERPDVHARAQRYLGPPDFLIYRLTGQFATDLSAVCAMLLVDASTGDWSPELCAIGGVDPRRQAALGRAGWVIGPITADVAACTGLPRECLVVAGGADQACACLGMGMLQPGRVALATGTGWVITAVTASSRLAGVPAAMDLSFHVAPQCRTVSQFLGGFGATVDWWLQQAWQPADPALEQPVKELYRRLDAALKESEPGSHGLVFTPLGGPAQLPGSPAGGAFAGLQLAHTRTDMARAILEGCAFEVRWALDQLAASGFPATELWIAGGASGSPVWPQTLADITRVPIVLADYANWAALGGAVLAGWGVGTFRTLEEGVSKLQPAVRRLMPDSGLESLYEERGAVYRRVASALASYGGIP